MNFHEYLGMRAGQGRGAAAAWAEHMRVLPPMPMVPSSWSDLRQWVERVSGNQQELDNAKAAWWAYVRYLRWARGDIPEEPQEDVQPVCAVPGSSGTVTDAPPLDHLRNLGHETRKIGRQIDAETWEWCGDLSNIIERRKYLIMLWENASVTQLSYFPTDNRMPLLFARIPRRLDPATAYRVVSESVEASVKQNPRWLTKGLPHFGLGVIR
jgi:hypothetical protein